MNKILMFDTEHGSHTLGGEAEIQEMFNCPVLKPAQFVDFRNIITSIYTVMKHLVKIYEDTSRIQRHKIGREKVGLYR